MNPYEKLAKLEELKAQYQKELVKEDKDIALIKKLYGQIFQLGLTLSSSDIINRRHG